METGDEVEEEESDDGGVRGRTAVYDLQGGGSGI